MATQTVQVPAAAAAESTTSTAASEADAASVHNITKLMTETKVDGGKKSAWAMTLETLGMSEGSKKKGDILCDSFDEALEKLTELTQAKEEEWSFSTTPFDDFKATKQDLFKAFVHWSRKGDEGETQYNASKAFRRLESYVEWMNKNCTGLDLKGSTMKEIADVWKMKLTHDKDGRLVWWVDISILDLKHIKTEVPPNDTLRYFVWLSHMVLFDQGSQEKGLVFVEGVGKTGIIEIMTAVSMDVGTKLDRLTIGILPIKMEAGYLFNSPTWMRVLMAMMSPFMGKKMRKRIKTVPKKTDPQEFFEQNIGKECIPIGISLLTGTVEKDMVAETLERLSS